MKKLPKSWSWTLAVLALVVVLLLAHFLGGRVFTALRQMHGS